MTLMAAETSHSTRRDITIKPPKMYKVVFNNDDQTPVDFVRELLKLVFHHDEKQAMDLTVEIHEQGRGIAGIYTFEIAEQKHNEATYIARTNGHPLNINVESE